MTQFFLDRRFLLAFVVIAILPAFGDRIGFSWLAAAAVVPRHQKYSRCHLGIRHFCSVPFTCVFWLRAAHRCLVLCLGICNYWSGKFALMPMFAHFCEQRFLSY